MMFKNINELYEKNHKVLLEMDGLRPAKSVTRSIHNSFEKFKEYYLDNRLLDFSQDTLENAILQTTSPSTVSDNVRNLQEFGLLLKVDYRYFFTRQFVDMVNNNCTIEEYILELMRKIYGLKDISMYLNLLLCTLREADIFGEIILFPDSFKKYRNKLPSEEDRLKMNLRVYSVYGFKSREREVNSTYTPNANYRIITTLVDLGLIIKNPLRTLFKEYLLTDFGMEILSEIDLNLANMKSLEDESSKYKDDEIMEMIEDEIYQEETVKEVDESEKINIIEVDLPEPIMNKIVKPNSKYYRRDPKRAKNAKNIANYKCEFDENHVTFEAQSTGKPYVEAHHLIPMSLQNKFYYSLDVEANIISLCPMCHRKLHHGVRSERLEILRKLYNNRIDRLKTCYILINLDDLLSEY